MTILNWAALAALLTALLWLPYVLARLWRHGLSRAVDNPPPEGLDVPPWAIRAQAAHRNAVENLVVFATLALVAQAAGYSDATLVTLAGPVYFFSRLTHFVVYTLGIPWLRTFAFSGGVVAQMMLAWQILI